MATGLETIAASTGIKAVVAALMKLLSQARKWRLKAGAEKKIEEAIRELLLAPSDLRRVEAKLAMARAAGILNADLFLAEDMLAKHKGVASRKLAVKKAAAKPVAKKAVAKRPATKKPAAKKRATKSR